MDETTDGFESLNKNAGVKHESVWGNCSISPLNSISENISKSTCNNNTPEEDTSSCENTSLEMLPHEDVLLVDIEIGTKKLDNVPVKCHCPLEDLAKEFAQNETVKVVYFLNEKITKGGTDCDVAEAQVMVKLKPNWKWLPIEDLVNDPSSTTIQDAFVDLIDHFQIVFGLEPRSQRTPMADAPSMASSLSYSEDQLAALVTDIKDVLSNYPILDLLNKDSLTEQNFTSEDNCHGLSQAKTKELKNLLLKLNSLLNSQHIDVGTLMCPPVHRNSSHNELSKHYPVQNHIPSTSSDTNVLNHKADRDISTSSEAAPLSRLRTQFDPNFEVPRLKQWFEENPIPSRSTITDYVNQLNSDEIRQGKQPVTNRAVYIWFKNTRARKYKKKSWDSKLETL